MIRRLILYALLYCSGSAGGHMYGRGLIYLCLSDEAGRAVVRHELSFCPDHVVVGRPYCAMAVCTPAPPRQTKVAICDFGSFWLGA